MQLTLSASNRLTQLGFTMLEILLSVFLLATGILGMTSMQTVSQRFNHSAYLYSQAVFQAYDIADRMRANNVGLDGGGYHAILVTSAATPPTVNCRTSASGCTPAELAEYDAWAWNSANALYLPSGAGTVTYDSTKGAFTVTVFWDDDRDGNLEAFNLEVRP